MFRDHDDTPRHQLGVFATTVSAMNIQTHSGREDGIVESFSKDSPAEQILNGALLFGSCVVAVVVSMYVSFLCFW